MTTVVLRACAPVQSWSHSRQDSHQSASQAPTKSGVAGLIANAMGYTREQDHAHLAAFQMAVRVDEQGAQETQLHTKHTSQADDHRKTATSMRNRLETFGACYLIAISYPNLQDTLAAWEALTRPARPLYLGRKGNLANEDLAHKIVETDPMTALRECGPCPNGHLPGEVIVHDTDDIEDPYTYWVTDIPKEIQGSRRFSSRPVKNTPTKE